MEKPEDNYLPREIKLLVIHCSATRCNVPFTVEQLENINAHIFHLGSLLADDFSLDVVKYLSTKGILAVDAQGYLREVRGEKVYPIDWTDKVEALKYIDYDLDVKVFADGEKKLLDVDEYETHKKEMHYSPDIDYILKEHVKILVDWINNGKGPFSQSYVNIWYKRYLELRNR